MSKDVETFIGQVQTLAEHGDWDISSAPVWKELCRLARLGAAAQDAYESNMPYKIKATNALIKLFEPDETAVRVAPPEVEAAIDRVVRESK